MGAGKSIPQDATKFKKHRKYKFYLNIADKKNYYLTNREEAYLRYKGYNADNVYELIFYFQGFFDDHDIAKLLIKDEKITLSLKKDLRL